MSALSDVSIAPMEPRDGVPRVITTQGALDEYAALLAAGTGPLAVDAERASGYRYSQRAYLVQIRREGAGTALIDPIPLPDLSVIQDATADVEWILHAASQDLGCLAELNLRPTALFDTELAGRLLGRERVSLAALVMSELGQVLEKGHGATDWSVRPLTAAQLRYAALDVELLVELRNILDSELLAAGKRDYACQEFTGLLSFAPRERGQEEWRRTSGIHRIRKPRALAIARSLWLARDDIAQSRDIAIGRVLPDAAIVAAATTVPADIEALALMKEFSGRGASRYIRRWWAAITEAQALSVAELPLAATPQGGPPQPRSWADRDPAAYARLEAARTAMAALVESERMPAENLLTPDFVRRLCWQPPEDGDVASALSSMGARQWQIDLCSPGLIVALQAVPAPEPAPETELDFSDE